MKRVLALILAMALLLCAVPALADQPQPIEIIPYEELPENFDGQHHYLMLCVDQWNAKVHNLGNTDGIVLVTLDTRAHRVMLTSLIRDALVQRPDGKIGRVNYIAKNYSPEELCKVLSQHFGIKIEKYILFDFNQIARIIDHLGGVNIEVNSSEASYLKRYPLEPRQTSPAMNNAGTYLFTGRAAVIYMRIRKVANIEGETQDVGRTRRSRTVLTTIADSLKNVTYDEAQKLLDVVIENTIVTNMSANDMLDALDLAMELKGTPVESIRMPIDGTYEPMPVAGMATQQIDFVKNREALWSFFLDSFVVVDE